MLIGTILFLAIPDVLLGFFNATETMLAIGEPALRIIASTFIVAGVCIVLGSVFQALGFSVYSMIVSLARQLFVLVPVAWALAAIGQRWATIRSCGFPSPSQKLCQQWLRRCSSSA